MIIYVDENDENTRLDSFLASVTKDLSRSKIQTLIKSGNVKVNEEIKKTSYLIKENDKIEFDIPENETVKIEPENLPLDVIYEDENMLVVNKPSGMLTHPAASQISGTLVNALLFKYGQNLSDINGEFRRGIVHRLDKNTSGLLMIAKNNKTHEYLADLIKNHKITKKYRTIVKGVYPKDEDIINLPISRHPTKPHKMTVAEAGKDSTTIIKVIERFKDATYLDVTLVTGRTHQIRVHMLAIGHPILSDHLYGHSSALLNHQALHAYQIECIHPITKEKLTLTCQPPSDMLKLIKKMGPQF